jgi:hypothetical protein
VVEFGEPMTMRIPDTVRKRQFPATGKWVAVEVYDTNWERQVQGLVNPAGELDCVWDGNAPFGWAQQQADVQNRRAKKGD